MTILALIAFAANSVLCRFALAGNLIDAVNFTNVRLLSGAIVLLLILQFSTNQPKYSSKGSWTSGFMLFLYAITFSVAYNSLNTGTGALILFGALQFTMFLGSIIKGYRLQLIELLGAIIAFAGFVYLILPGVTAPSPVGFIFMTLAGISWGIYTLSGHKSQYPLIDTAYNFIRTLPLILILFTFTFNSGHFSIEGLLLAILSGGIASGIGYTIWYFALRDLSSIQAAIVQLIVPVLATFGGVLFISESITLRLFFSSLLILSGILLVIYRTKTE